MDGFIIALIVCALLGAADEVPALRPVVRIIIATLVVATALIVVLMFVAFRSAP